MSTDQLTPLATSTISLQEAAEFIWQEAEYLDHHDYKSWLNLWHSTDSLYVIPIGQDDEADLANVLNIAYDDGEMREARVKRLRSGFSMSSAPSARTSRTVSRFVVVEDGTDGLTLRAAQHIVEYKQDRTRILAGDVLYRLVRTDGDISLIYKEIRLINSDDALWGIGYLL